MKTPFFLSLLSIVSFATLTAHAGTRDIPVEIAIASLISQNGDTSEITLKNRSPEPLICDTVEVAVNLVEGEFNQRVSEVHTRFRNVFMRAGQTLTEKNIGVAEIQQLKEQGRATRILSVSPSLGSCRVAELADYCSFATLSPSEKFTLESLNQHYGVARCEDWKTEYQTTLRMNQRGITDLRPFAYFRQLRVLSLRQNSITDLRPLKRLRSLERIQLSENPITSVDAIRSLPQLELVCVNATPVASKESFAKPFSASCRWF